MDTTSQTFSLQNIISEFQKKYGKTFRTEEIEEYLLYMEEAYLLSNVKRYDVEGKKYWKLSISITLLILE